jgi:uncharacterized protein YcbK (DUF882 family)|nr:DUF882 domain-containing protein [Kofleriaceae bacterium]
MRALTLTLLIVAGVSSQAWAKPTFVGHNAPKSSLRTTPLDKPSGNIKIKADNLDESLDINIYKSDGTLDDAVLAQLDKLWRCTATGQVRAVNSDLYVMLSRIYDHFGGKEIHIVSGFRATDNDSSRHWHASAMDIRVEATSYRTVYEFAQTLDVGGDHSMGIGQYPNSEFVHIDFRAPGDVSFRWTDYSGGSHKKSEPPAKKKSTGRTQPARKPVS